MAGYGTPIRLIFDDPDAMAAVGYHGGMELMAESIAIGVDRSVGGSSMPFTGGKRFALDLNLSNSLIQIDGIFVDDDLTRRSNATTGAKATANIDFGVTYNAAVNYTVRSPVDIFAASRLSSIEKIEVKDVAGNTYTITFSLTGTVGTISGSGTTRDIVIYDGSSTYITQTALATQFATAIGAASSNAVTGAATESEYLGAGNNTQVDLTQGSTGVVNNAGINFHNRAVSGIPQVEPKFTPFSGGIPAPPAKSAGDKVQDLYGILNNTARKGSAIVGGIVIGAAAAAATVATGGAAGVAIASAGAAGGVGALAGGLFSVKGDYPIGIQIPYNSIVQAADGDKYAVRNFIVPTGIGKTVVDKMSDGNVNPASVEFDTGDNMTGIQGTVNSFTAVYDAGEQVYGFKLTFVPIDSIL